MKYSNKNFYIENVKAENLAKKFNTPIYCYSYAQLRKNVNRLILDFILNNIPIISIEETHQILLGQKNC